MQHDLVLLAHDLLTTSVMDYRLAARLEHDPAHEGHDARFADLRHKALSLSHSESNALLRMVLALASPTLLAVSERGATTSEQQLNEVIRQMMGQQYGVGIPRDAPPRTSTAGDARVRHMERHARPAPELDGMTARPSDADVVFEHPCCEMVASWDVELPMPFDRREAAWWASWHIDRHWALDWARAGWRPDEIKTLLRKVRSYKTAAQWVRTDMGPEDVLEHALNGADVHPFLYDPEVKYQDDYRYDDGYDD